MLKPDSLLQHTGRITIETHNRCNYAHLHKLCPVSTFKVPVFLPIEIIRGILEYAAADGFDREIAWHNYSEPMIEPRLFLFLDMARGILPEARSYILTNGSMLTQTTMDELYAHGVRRLWVTAYSDAEQKRLKTLRPPEGQDYNINRLARLDERLTIYDRDPAGDRHPCYEPLESLVIRATGDVDLCCNDWAMKYTFGNLHEMSLQDVLATGKMQETWERLKKGDRFLPICKRCKCRRGTKLTEPSVTG